MDRVANSNAEYIFDCVHPDDVGELEVALSALCKKRTIERQVRLSSHSGEWKHFDLTLRKRLLQDGSMECSITGTDITDDHQYQQHRQVLNRVLRHNLRNDLNVISGHALVLRDEDIDSKVTNHADVIHRNADSLSDLVEKVRTITQEVYGADQQVSVTNIADVIREEIAEVRNDERDAEFRTELEEIPTAGNQLLRIAIKNILENAIEHNPSRHPIVNVVSEYDTDLDRVIVRIADNGTGIPPGEVQAISRGRESQLEHTSGVGLWITKWIANGLGGTVLFNTDSSEWGTVVEFSLQPAR
jgi:signal transduction histidine kinase